MFLSHESVRETFNEPTSGELVSSVAEMFSYISFTGAINLEKSCKDVIVTQLTICVKL